MDSLSSGSEAVRKALVAATAVALGLDLIALARYPPTGSRALMAAAGGPFLLLALAAWFWWVGFRDRSDNTAAARRMGIVAGLVGGAIWVMEISFNNFVSARSTEPLGALVSHRDRVDNIFWALVALAILAGSMVAGLRTGRWRDGLVAGLWGGLVSGLAACAMGLALVAVWMEFLMRDPVNIAEFAQRVGDRSVRAMAAYFAYETMAGAFMHLVILGVVMGILIGVVGGLPGKLIGKR